MEPNSHLPLEVLVMSVLDEKNMHSAYHLAVSGKPQLATKSNPPVNY